MDAVEGLGDPPTTTAVGILTTDGSHQTPLQELPSAEENCPAPDYTPLEKGGYQGLIAMRISSLYNQLYSAPLWPHLQLRCSSTLPPPQSGPSSSFQVSIKEHLPQQTTSIQIYTP